VVGNEFYRGQVGISARIVLVKDKEAKKGKQASKAAILKLKSLVIHWIQKFGYDF